MNWNEASITQITVKNGNELKNWNKARITQNIVKTSWTKQL